MRFKVNEIFHSLQGEGSRAGRPCLFVRLSGCPLRCVYCDTTYAYHEGEVQELESILTQVSAALGPVQRGPNAAFVELTGGEPLAHPEAPALLKALLDLGYEVALETAGSHDLSRVDPRVVKIVDRKTPGSGESARWLDANLDYMISGQDELKFVLASVEDYHWAKAWCRQTGVMERLDVLFSPVWGQLDATWLAEEIIKDNLPVRFQLQLHKLLWDPARRGV